MNVMALDVELNQAEVAKVIQIGAAVFDATSGQLVAKMELFVNPNEPIVPRITELTGITDAQVSGAPSIQEAYKILKDFHKKHKCFINPIVWGSGVRNDSLSIYQEASPKDENGVLLKNFMGYRVIDVKSQFQSLQLYTNNKIGGGLAEACQRMGIGFEGTPHTALADAINTFRIWHKLNKKLASSI